MSKMEINIADFITDEHKAKMQDKIAKAIEAVNTEEITKEITSALKEEFFENGVNWIIEDMDYSLFSDILQKELIKYLKQRFEL